MDDFKDRVFLFRAKNRITQRDLAKMCGVSVQTIWAVENGHQDPSKMTRTKIEMVIGKGEGESV